ncbi:MAG: YbaB/EbfC family nucleoid-associated protein [Acidobacteriota bacterium]
MDWSKLFSRAQEMQGRFQKELGETVVEASAGGGMVAVRMNGLKQLLSIKIERDAVDPEDVATLESLVLSACNEASRQVDEVLKGKLGQLAGLRDLLDV